MFQRETLAGGFPRVDLASRLPSSRSASGPKPPSPSPPPPLPSSSHSVSAAPPQPAYYTRSVSVRPSRHLCCSRTTTLLANSKRPRRGERNTVGRDDLVACVASPSPAAASPVLIPGLTTSPTQLPSTSYPSSPAPSRPPSVSPCPPPSPLTLLSDPEQAAPLSAPRGGRGRRTASPSGGHQQHQLMCQPPSERTLRAVLRAVLPAHVTIQKKSWAFSSDSSNRVQRIYGLDLSDDRELRLVMDPDPSLRLLRSEQWLVESEAAVVSWVRDVLTREKLAVDKVLNLESHQHRHRRSGGSGSGATEPCGSSNTTDRSTTCHPTPPGVVVSRSGGPSPGPSSSSSSSRLSPRGATTLTHHARAYPRPPTRPPDPGLLDFVPSLLSPPTSTDTPNSVSSSHSPSPPSVFAIFGLPRQSSNWQITASQLLLQSSTPDPSEQKAVDFQVGRFVRQISRLTSPTGRFGPAVAVLPCPPSGAAADGAGGLASNNDNGNNSNKAPMVPSLGAGTWSMAFHSMLEGVLRDGEDMAVTVPYVHIRRHFRRLGFLLDTVTTPRLVLVDAADYSNVMVAVTKRDSSEGVEKDRGGGETKASTKTKGNRQTTTRTTEAAGDQDDSASENVIFTGLADWSNCVFGDPLFTRAFCDGPSSAEFLDGFNGSSPTGREAVDADDDDNDLIDDRDVSPIRLLLYQCYHLTVCIVREFYRPRGGGGSTSRELEARKRLREVLARLEEVDDDPKRRHRRPSGDMSPAKKSRQES